MLKIDRTAWRCYVAGRRIHHGAVGCFLIGFGLALAAHDLKDWKEWF